MKQLFKILMMAVFATAFIACNDDDGVSFVGKDNYIVAFSLTVDGVTYDASITEGKIKVSIPYNVSLENAKASYTLSENARINPDPAEITAWDEEWQFIATADNKENRVYHYTYEYSDISKSGNVVLETQADVDKFKATQINSIDGNLTIGTDNGDGIENLDGLSNLESVTNSIIIKSSYKGQNLEGLASLKHAGSIKLGTLYKMSDNETLEDIALPALEEITGDLILRNALVKNINLPLLASVGETFNITTDNLTSVNVNMLSFIGDDLTLIGSTTATESSDIESIVFPQLKKVGGNMTIQYQKSMTSIYYPVLEEIDGMTTLDQCSQMPGLVFPELVRSGGFTFTQCSALSDIQAPEMLKSGEIYIRNCSNVNNIDFSKMTEVDGDLYLNSGTIKDLTGFAALETVNGVFSLVWMKNVSDFSCLSKLKSVNGLTVNTVSFTELDLRGTDFNGGELSLRCENLTTVKADDTFNGSINIQPLNASRITSFTFEGFSVINGNFESGNFNYVTAFTLPMKIIKGDAIIAVSSLTAAPVKDIDIPNLTEVGGSLTIQQIPKAATKCSFGSLMKVGKSLNMKITSSICGVEMPKLQSIGEAFTSEENKVSTWQISDEEEFNYPELTIINGSLTINTGAKTDFKIEKFSFPKLKAIEGGLTISPMRITDAYRNEALTTLEFPSLESVESIKIVNQNALKNFSTFAPLFTKNILTETSQWSVSTCGYNPTYADMKAGKYAKP